MDSIDFLGMTLGLPEQFQSALDRAKATSVAAIDASKIESVVVLGLGGSGVSGDIVAAVLSPSAKVPVLVSKQYELPAFVGPQTLVIATSYSGTTEETLSAVQMAQEQNAPMIVVCSGGALEQIAQNSKTPCVQFQAPANMQPRAAMGALLAPIFVALDRLGIFPEGIAECEAAISQAVIRRDECKNPQDKHIVSELIEKIATTIPVIYGGGLIGAAAAYRFKCDFNENAKAPAYWHQYPELCHNEIVGYGQHGDVTRQLLTLVELRHDYEHPQVQKRFDISRELIREALHDVVQVHAGGTTRLAQLVDLCYIGSLASVFLAIQAGVDPGPVDVIWQLKNALAPA